VILAMARYGKENTAGMGALVGLNYNARRIKGREISRGISNIASVLNR